jgi:hypothetical protein
VRTAFSAQIFLRAIKLSSIARPEPSFSKPVHPHIPKLPGSPHRNISSGYLCATRAAAFFRPGIG